MKLIVLGCGTSTGVPIIGCRCGICSSKNPRNKRTRSSLLVEAEGRRILIDTSTDLRSQAIVNGIDRIDAVLFTHPHADHIHGIDDLRAFNLTLKAPIPCFGSAHTIERIQVMFDYIFMDGADDGWKPSLTTAAVDAPFALFGLNIVPVEILHGRQKIFGYRIGPAAYLTDCSAIPEGAMGLLQGLDTLILGALRQKPHPTHFSIAEAIEASRAIKPRRTIFTHLGHNVDYEKDGLELPAGVELAYDGMVIDGL